jgi:hypothetical protein
MDLQKDYELTTARQQQGKEIQASCSPGRRSERPEMSIREGVLGLSFDAEDEPADQ